ncbi:MmgE/PrpD family protein [Pseudonocardia oroxyli]|uniref:2-methylcitrate dehydratase PrpD n=1 Tax=Pseudonocardia oroxyli TaxID=366584 RepID=A0A1G7SPV8_PSEOR|nr:MmgE/PrpD family protein [Pseudonocardia oroxyli]SDG24922.1 2-methylcitrate dehydratase PrpD [Pseudonocardia oroxyli]
MPGPSAASRLTAALIERTVAGPGVDEAGAALVGRAVADTVAVMLAGAHEPAPVGLREALTPPPGPAFVVGVRGRTAPDHAALLNGAAAHALDFDDVCHSVKGHPSTVLVPALLAVADRTAPTGRDLVDAYGVGLDVGAAVWSGFGPDHYARGWHATSTVGVVAATAGVARLLRLSAAQVGHALGVAASFAGGLRQNFGTDTKVLHAGIAAEGAVRACLLGAAGVTSEGAALGGPLGMLHVLGAGDVEGALGALAGPSVLTGRRGLNVKRYPCCYFAHRAVDAVLELPVPVPDDVAWIEVTVPPGSLSALKYDDPHTGLEGKFSGPYVIAAAMLQRELTLADFTDAAVARPGVRELARRVRWSESPTPPLGAAEWQDGYAVVRVEHRDGRVDQTRVDVPRGHAQNPLDDHEIEAKFRSCTEHLLGTERAIRAARRLRTIATAEDASTWSVDLDRHPEPPTEESGSS